MNDDVEKMAKREVQGIVRRMETARQQPVTRMSWTDLIFLGIAMMGVFVLGAVTGYIIAYGV